MRTDKPKQQSSIRTPYGTITVTHTLLTSRRNYCQKGQPDRFRLMYYITIRRKTLMRASEYIDTVTVEEFENSPAVSGFMAAERERVQAICAHALYEIETMPEAAAQNVQHLAYLAMEYADPDILPSRSRDPITRMLYYYVDYLSRPLEEAITAKASTQIAQICAARLARNLGLPKPEPTDKRNAFFLSGLCRCSFDVWTPSPAGQKFAARFGTDELQALYVLCEYLYRPGFRKIDDVRYIDVITEQEREQVAAAALDSVACVQNFNGDALTVQYLSGVIEKILTDEKKLQFE